VLNFFRVGRFKVKGERIEDRGALRLRSTAFEERPGGLEGIKRWAHGSRRSGKENGLGSDHGERLTIKDLS
jgi:hypothetical protein